MRKTIKKISYCALNGSSVLTAPLWLPPLFWVALVVNHSILPWGTKSFILEIHEDWI